MEKKRFHFLTKEMLNSTLLEVKIINIIEGHHYKSPTLLLPAFFLKKDQPFCSQSHKEEIYKYYDLLQSCISRVREKDTIEYQLLGNSLREMTLPNHLASRFSWASSYYLKG